jgi:hypothetical protein
LGGKIARDLPWQAITRNPAARAATGVLSLLREPQHEYPVDQAVEHYNSIVAAGDSPYTVPVIASRAREFTKENAGTRPLASVRELTWDKVEIVCPEFLTVQRELDGAAAAVGPASNFPDAKTYGTAVHVALARRINPEFNPALRRICTFEANA